MGIRFRKSFKVAPGIRMNLSSSGLGASFGPRGASVSVGARGVYANAGIPGTGLSARQRLDPGSGVARLRQKSDDSPSISLRISVGVRDDGELYFQQPDGSPLPEHLVAVAKKQQSAAIKGLIQAKCDEINKQVESLGELHLATPPPNVPQVFERSEFSEPRPEVPVPKELGFIARLFAAKRDRNRVENDSERVRYESAMDRWEHARRAHTVGQEERRVRIEELIYTNIDAMEMHLEETLMSISWPRETLISAQVQSGGQTVLVDVDLPELEDLPSKTAGVPARGMKLSVKDISQAQRQKLYMRHVHGIAFRIIGETFAALPQAQTVVVSGYSQRPSRATGQVGDEYLYSVRVGREVWSEINFDPSGLSAIDIVQALESFELLREMSKSGAFQPIVPFGS